MIVITKEDGYTVVTDTSIDDIAELYDITDSLDERTDVLESGVTSLETGVNSLNEDVYFENDTPYVFQNITGYGYVTTGGGSWILFYLNKNVNVSEQEIDSVTLDNCYLRGIEGILRFDGETTTINNVTIPAAKYIASLQTSPEKSNIISVNITGLDTTFRYNVQTNLTLLTKLTIQFKEKETEEETNEEPGGE